MKQLLQEHLEERRANGVEDEGDEDAKWEEGSEDSDASESGWIAVSDDDRDIELSDSEDDDDDRKAKKTKRLNSQDVVAEAEAIDADGEVDSEEEDDAPITFTLAPDSDDEAEDDATDEQGPAEAASLEPATAAWNAPSAIPRNIAAEQVSAKIYLLDFMLMVCS